MTRFRRAGMTIRSGVAFSLAALVITLGTIAHTARSTDAAFSDQQVSGTHLAAASVPQPTATCTATAGQPHTLRWSIDDPDKLVTGYELTLTSTPTPSAWQGSGSTNGVQMYPLGMSELPAGATAAAWGIDSSSGGGPFTGTATLQAVGPGGWTSGSVQFNWSISFDWLGFATVSCTPATR